MNNEMISPFKTWTSFIIANLILGFIIALISVNSLTIKHLAIGTIWGATISITQWLGQVWIQVRLKQSIVGLRSQPYVLFGLLLQL